MEKKVLTMPIKEEDVRELKLGDVVYLTGHIFTSRDMGHLRIRQLLEKGEPLPKDFHGAAIFHAGPVCLKNAGFCTCFLFPFPNAVVPAVVWIHKASFF